MSIRKQIITLTCLFMVLLSGCSNKKNVLGEENDHPLYLVEIGPENLFETYFSYENETKNYIRNNKSITGHFRGNESITLLRFANFPSSGFVLSEDAKLTLQIKSEYNSQDMVLRIGKIRQFWHHFYATWEKAEQDVEWNYDWNTYETLEIMEGIEYIVNENDSTVVFTFSKELMEDLIEEWEQEEPESFGFALFNEKAGDKPETDKYLEFYTREHVNGPLLKFEYYPSEGDTTKVVYERMPVHNTFINSKEPAEDYFTGHEIKIGNILPTRSLLKLNLSKDFFEVLPPDGNIKMITVNKAELILFRQKEEENYHFPEMLFEIFPYSLLQDYDPYEENGKQLPVETGDYETLVPSFTSVLLKEADSVAVNITSIVQAHISEIKTNYGFLLTSPHENRDNGFVTFYGPEHVEEKKRPVLRIIYSLPPDF